VPQVSHTVEHLSNGLLIFFIGREAISIASRHSLHRAIDRVATLGDHLSAVRIVLSHFVCFVHAHSMARNQADFKRWWTVRSLAHARRPRMRSTSRITWRKLIRSLAVLLVDSLRPVGLC